MIISIELLALSYILYAQTMIVCGVIFYTIKYCIEQFEVLPGAWVPAFAGTHAELLYTN